MHILTLITKRSVKEIIKTKKFLLFYTTEIFEPGDMIEIIDGNKKSPAIILKSTPLQEMKEKIRSGNLEIKKIKFSKTGKNANGRVFDHFEIKYIKELLKNNSLAQADQNKNISNFFPKKRKIKKTTFTKTTTKKGVDSIKNILEQKIKKPKTYHNQMQELVDIIRNYFDEEAVYGTGSFSYYIGFFKNIPLEKVYQFFAEVKQTKKTRFEQKKLFWWKIGQFKKKKNN